MECRWLWTESDVNCPSITFSRVLLDGAIEWSSQADELWAAIMCLHTLTETVRDSHLWHDWETTVLFTNYYMWMKGCSNSCNQAAYSAITAVLVYICIEHTFLMSPLFIFFFLPLNLHHWLLLGKSIVILSMVHLKSPVYTWQIKWFGLVINTKSYIELIWIYLTTYLIKYKMFVTMFCLFNIFGWIYQEPYLSTINMVKMSKRDALKHIKRQQK